MVVRCTNMSKSDAGVAGRALDHFATGTQQPLLRATHTKPAHSVTMYMHKQTHTHTHIHTANVSYVTPLPSPPHHAKCTQPRGPLQSHLCFVCQLRACAEPIVMLYHTPGFINSHLARMVQPVCSDTRRSFTSGVWPTAPVMPFT